MSKEFGARSSASQSRYFPLFRWGVVAFRPLCVAVAIILAAWILAPAIAEETQPATPAALPTVEAPSEATVMYMNRPIVTLRVTISGMPPEERASRIHRRLVELDDAMLRRTITVEHAEIGDVDGVFISLEGVTMLLGIADGDVDPETNQTAEQLGQEVKARLEEAFAARLEQRRLPVLLRGIALSAAGALFAIGLIWFVWRLRARAGRWFDSLIARQIKTTSGAHIEWERYGYEFTARVVQLATTFAVLILIYLWLTFALGQFPLTAPLGEQLGGYLFSILSDLGAQAVAALPGILTVLIILLVAQALSRVIGNLTEAVEDGRVTLPFLQRDTARATRQILKFVVWGIALAIAYPYIPGSDSLAFQGLSVLFGLMISLGSTGVVSQIMAGTVLAYSRALHPGDFVRVGEIEGTVLKVGAISTKLLTPNNEEVTIPNSVLIEDSITNYSQRYTGSSSVLSTSVTIGYDTPWRQVHAMLLMAAGQVEGVLGTPEPYVAQKALTDFYVQYELFVVVEWPGERRTVLSQLHSNIQDIFNEYGVQIMSPQYYEQPPQPLIVPKEKWFTPPARE